MNNLKKVFTIEYLLLFMLVFSAGSVQSGEDLTGQQIMDEVLRLQQEQPYVYEEQTMILIDRSGNQDVRKTRRFSRVEKDGTAKYLLVFDNPLEIRGVALLAIRHTSGRLESGIYLPAFGKELKSNVDGNTDCNFLGTDFTIEDLMPEKFVDYRYERKKDIYLNRIRHFLIDASPQVTKIKQATGYGLLRHFIHPETFFIVRTDYFDHHGRLYKRLTNHDLKRVSGDIWQPSMILMENMKTPHRTLLKIDRRIFSRDYVPTKIFQKEWILDDKHIQNTEKRLFQDTSAAIIKNGNQPSTVKVSKIK